VKLSGDAAARFARRPDPETVGVLLHGVDAGQVALHRRDLVAAVTEGDAMRLSRLDPDAVRRDPAALADALRARGFFPGRMAVLIDGAKDGVTEAVAAALDGLRPDDALLIVTATGLTAKSPLRKRFEAGRGVAALAFYPDAAENPADLLRAEGCLARPTPEAEAVLHEIAADLDPGSLRQFAATLALYATDLQTLEAGDVTALAPARSGATDRLTAAVAGGAPDQVPPLVGRLSASGTTAQGMLSAVTRHFRLLHRLAADPGGPRRAIEGLRPPVFGPRRDRLLAEAPRWPVPRAEQALRLLHEAELTLRSTGPRPERALAERCLLRLAMMGARER